MEAVPRLHMLWFALKASPEGTSFSNLKKYIAETYQEDAESYSKEIFELEKLRNEAFHSTQNLCIPLKRYYCQLHYLVQRFPHLKTHNVFTFTWKDLYKNNIKTIMDIRFEMAAILFDIATSHTQVGASITRGDADGMKLACTHFQCAAWCFGELRKRYEDVNSGTDFMTAELLVFMQQVSFAQAQECILEKSLLDNRKPNIVAKVTAQIVVYYNTALAALLTGGDNGPISQTVENNVFKLWKKYVKFKISYLNCILYLYQGQHAEEQQKMGERVTLYQAAWEQLEDAQKESKGLPDQKEISESLIFTADVVEAKRKNAKNENEFIYHELVPDLSSIPAVQGANLVNGIPFSTSDPDVAGPDIFSRLIPMKVHEASSLYSEEKAKLLRKYSEQIAEKDTELVSFMSSLTSVEHLNVNEEKTNKIPQGIVDRCAALHAKKTAITELITVMAQLADICADVEVNLNTISNILDEEDRQEKEFQVKTGVNRNPPNGHIIELTKEFQKYTEAHVRAGESNDTLRKAMELHVNNLKILARPLNEIQKSAPKLSSELNISEVFKDLKLILNKVNEMKAQRSQFIADLRIALNDDDITAKVIMINYQESTEHLNNLFKSELEKHTHLTQLIDHNLLAQKNILQALTEAYARAAPILKTLADVKYKRENFFSSLAASYDIYEDLLIKSAKGLEFYKKLSGNVQKLLSRLKSARDVQLEEREQRLKKTQTSNAIKPHSTNVLDAAHSSTPKLRDYLKTKTFNVSSPEQPTPTFSQTTENSTFQKSQFVPAIRPNPLGSENPTQFVCTGSVYSSNFPNITVPPNEPPPPYTQQKGAFLDNASSNGYTNPIFQAQQNIAPPAYSLNPPTYNSNSTLQPNHFRSLPAESLIPSSSQNTFSTIIPYAPQLFANESPNPMQTNSQSNFPNPNFNTNVNMSIYEQSQPINEMVASITNPLNTPEYKNFPSSPYTSIAHASIPNSIIDTSLIQSPHLYSSKQNSESNSFQSNPSFQLSTPTNYSFGVQYSQPTIDNAAINQLKIEQNSNHSTTYDVPIISHVKPTDGFSVPSGQFIHTVATSINLPQHQSLCNTDVLNQATSIYAPKQLETSESIPVVPQTITTTQTSVTKPMQKIKSKPNLDLLTDFDSTIMPPLSLPPPNLQPMVVNQFSKDKVEVNDSKPMEKSNNIDENILDEDENAIIELESLRLSPVPHALSDNLTTDASKISLSDIKKTSSETLMQKDYLNEDSSISLTTAHSKNKHKLFPNTNCDPFSNENTLKHFHKEVERYEKIIDNLNVKTLNGNTYISAKWKELKDNLARNSDKRTIIVAKLFPEKNRSINCVPFDQTRVKLEKSTDDYINAAFIPSLSPNCPPLIIAQTPQQNTVNDFWSMVWSQKALTLACLHTPGEMPIDFYWPREINKEMVSDEFVIKCTEIASLTHSTAFKLNLQLHGTESSMNISVLQINQWMKNFSAKNILENALDIIQVYKMNYSNCNNECPPLILNCLTGSDRSPIVALTISVILGTEITPPILLNVSDVWCKMCSHRSISLENMQILINSMHIVLNHSHNILNKHGIITSYQIKNASKAESLEETQPKDPLSELDPLWKLK